jgi:hypothetical protein
MALEPITIGNVTINRGIEHTSTFWLERINQNTQVSSTGVRFNFDNSRSILRGIIEIRYITKAEADALRNFIVNTIRFGRFQFDIIPASYNDLGLGDGITIPLASYDGDFSTADIIKPIGKANKFNVSFSYFYAINPTAATVDHEGVSS